MTAARSIRLSRDALAAAPVMSIDLAGYPVVVASTEVGVFALADRCPHRGARLSAGGQLVAPLMARSGRLTPGPRRSHVRCPWHKWDFELESGRCLVDDRLRVRTYHAWVDGDDVVVSLDPREKSI
jgi:nitrite reductase (NADH) small subunit